MEHPLYTPALCRTFIELFLTFIILLTLTKKLPLKILTHSYTKFLQRILWC